MKDQPRSTEDQYYFFQRGEKGDRQEAPRLGGEVSERQWKDLIGVLKIQGDRLDFNYLKKWAGDLGLSALLEKAINEVGARET